MAKEQWHHYLRTVLTIIAIAFAGGGYAMKIHDNSTSIEKQDARLSLTCDKVHELEVNQERDIALKEGLLNTLSRMESKVDSSLTEQQTIKTDIAVMKTKVNTLTKDE